MIMHQLSLALACLACTGCGQQVQASSRGWPGRLVEERQAADALPRSHSSAESHELHGQGSGRGTRGPLKGFAAFLLALNPAVALCFSGPTACCSRAQNRAGRLVRSDITMVSQSAMAAMATSDRAQRIKNILIDKEILNLLSSCEFTMCLDVTELKGDSSTTIDYTSLIVRINRSLDILRLRYNGKTNEEDALVERLLRTRDELNTYVQTLEDPTTDLEDLRKVGPGDCPVTLPEETGSSSIKQLRENLQDRVSFLVREDGSVDWNEAKEVSREVAKFGSELWERLNGEEEEVLSIEQLFGKGAAKSELITDEVRSLREVADKATLALTSMQEQKTNITEQLRQAKTEGRPTDLALLRRIDDKLAELSKLVTLSNLNLDMERICVYLTQELEEGGSAAIELKFVVAEVNLIERQLKSVMGGLGEIDIEEAMQGEETNLLLSLVDVEEVNLIATKVDDLKSRLGVVGSRAAPIDWGSFGEEVQKIKGQIQEGLSFYGEGTRMLASDGQYCLRLFAKAITGYTLKPREVNVLRRTFRDLLTLVPCTIILIIPLTPIGHVLVFSFIQRFFPDFFPSCYTEKRLNLQRLYSEVLSKSEEAFLGKPTLLDRKGKRA